MVSTEAKNQSVSSVSDEQCRPQIVVAGRQDRELVADAEAALVTANDPPHLYVRGNALARIVEGDDGRPLIAKVGQRELLERLTEAADFHVEQQVHQQYFRRPTSPPSRVSSLILGRSSWPFPRLDGLTEVPVLRPDGTVLSEPGYDPDTRLVFVPESGATAMRVPPAPSAGEVERATESLRMVLADFPLVDQASWANMVGLLLSPIVRPAIDGNVPLALIDKPQPGTGATLLANIVALVATGREAAVMTAPVGEAEWRRTLTAKLMTGSPVVVLDNVDSVLRSDTLAAVLTTRTWEDRRLRSSEIVTVPQRAVWIATGNNIELGGDLPRRAYLIRLDAKAARPWLRSNFAVPDLGRTVATNRGLLVGVLLTLARAWVVAGKPLPSSARLGGFEQWSDTIGGILEHAGVEGFLSNLGGLYDGLDAQGGEWERFLEALEESFRERSFRAAEVQSALAGGGPRAAQLAEALPREVAEAGKRRGSHAAVLGQAFAKRRNVRQGKRQLRIEEAGSDGHSKTKRWRVASG